MKFSKKGHRKRFSPIFQIIVKMENIIQLLDQFEDKCLSIILFLFYKKILENLKNHIKLRLSVYQNNEQDNLLN